jgi:hypothetical protein
VKSDPGAELRAAFSAAYHPYLERRLAELGAAETPGLEAVVAAGQEWLDGELGELLAAPFSEQSRSPLEVFQEAMRFTTELLDAAGVRPPERDSVETAALPGDLYGLAPASSQELGDGAWRAHLAWGVAKARAMAIPRVGLLAADDAGRGAVEAAAVEQGFRLESWDDLDTVESALAGRGPVLAFVDLDHHDADGALAALAKEKVRTIAYGAGVDDLVMVRAKTLGAADVLPKRVFLDSVRDLLPRLL